MIDTKRFKEALERGLDAGSRVLAKGYLGGNTEEKMREAICVAFEHYFDEMTPGRWRKHKWVEFTSRYGEPKTIMQCDRCMTTKDESTRINDQELCPL